jgi:hypothetical protein
MTGITNLPAAVESLREIVGRMTPGEWQSGNRFGFVGVFDASERVLANTHGATTNVGIEELVRQQDATAAGIVALRNAALPIIDAQAARIAELEACVRALQSTRTPAQRFEATMSDELVQRVRRPARKTPSDMYACCWFKSMGHQPDCRHHPDNIAARKTAIRAGDA